MTILAYDRIKAAAYAKRWAFGRNPAYYNFDPLGGDCTNFISQCLYAGSGVMNFTPVTGWYYRSLNDRTAAWTGVEYLFRFLRGNEGLGPSAAEVQMRELELGDVVQLGFGTGDFYHSLLVTGFRLGVPLVAAHTFDAFDRPLSSYSFGQARCLHIEGVRVP